MRAAQPIILPPAGFHTAPAGSPYAFRRSDGAVVLDFKLWAGAVRDLHSSVIQLAKAVKLDHRIKWGCLVLVRGRLTAETALQEWTEVVDGLFDAALRRRLALIWVEADVIEIRPEAPEIRHLADAVKTALGASSILPAAQPRARGVQPLGWPQLHPAMNPSLFEIVKILLSSWLHAQDPLPVGEIQRLAGVAYPTVASALQILEARNEVIRRSDRSAELACFPSGSWSEILALSDNLRRPTWYADRSGRPLDPEFLLHRLEQNPIRGIALGGVIAARCWDPSFDLNGLPRIDVVAHLGSGLIPQALLGRVDPSLRASLRPDERTVLVIHPLRRKEPCFEHSKSVRIPIADPVETLLDLYEMRLVSQAEELIHAMRRGHEPAQP